MKLYCPRCGTEFPAADINVAGDIAYCRQCAEAYAISQLLGNAPPAPEPLPDPTTSIPKGCWYRETMDGWIAGATTRSPMAFFIIPFMCVWSGGSLGSIYGSQIIQGKFNPLISLFGIPFLLGSIVLGSLAVMCVAGKVELTASGDDLIVFTGVGTIGWKKKATITSASKVFSQGINIHYPGSNNAHIIVEGPTNIRFGSGLSFARQMFLVQLLRYKFNLPE